MENIKKIIVLFKSHLDVGFTDLSSEVVRQYNEEHIPMALSVGDEIARLNKPEGYVWTVGSWLIHQYFWQCDEAGRKRMDNAIRKGRISWHALPFTMHSEVADADLYRYGLSFSQELDRQFGRRTIGAKNTDVPGHTRSIVPLLQEAGVKFLHIGVNAASPPPDVPDLFRWAAPTGESVTVMYNNDYGVFTQIPHTDTAICFGLFGDNWAPQSAREILEFYDRLRTEYPSALIHAGDLNDVAAVVAGIADKLPVFMQEIGDTWIHGAGTDPKKVNQYRSLLRLAKDLDEESRNRMYEHLVMIPEHTWGLDEKVFLDDRYNYKRELFDVAKHSEMYEFFESSWEEQREYVTKAVESLSGESRLKAEEAVAQSEIAYPDLSMYESVPNASLQIRGWNIKINENGAVSRLAKGNADFTAPEHPLGLFKYEVFCERQLWEYILRYSTQDVFWSFEAFGKLGLGGEMDHYECFLPECDGVYRNQDEIIVTLMADKRAAEEYGCPPKMILKIIPGENGVDFDFAWFNKPANRIPEFCWLGFCFNRELKNIQKMGAMIDPKDVVSKGNREMHCTDGLLQFDGLSFTTWDAPIVSIGKPYAYAFYNELPETDKGVWINLFNNQWGTNFPMWNSGNARFRFSLILSLS